MNVERAEPGGPQWAERARPAAPGIADYPIVPAGVAEIQGAARFTVAICGQPVATEVIRWDG